MNEFYVENCALQAPGLAIHGAGSPIVKAVNGFASKANRFISTILATADLPGLETAEGLGAVAVGDLANGFARMYSFLSAIDPVTGDQTISVVAGADYLATSLASFDNLNTGNPENEDWKKAFIGFVIVTNTSGSAFVPGTTNLDAAGIAVTYVDVFGFVGA